MNEAAFLQAIRDDPEDAPRLVFADWLEDQGDPRAELIRIQVELARTAPHDDNHLDLAIRQDRWFHEHADRWLSRLPNTEEDPTRYRFWIEWQHRRGLPEMVRVSTFAAFRRLSEVSVAHTALLGIHFSNLTGCKALAKSRLLEGVRDLHLYDSPFGDAGIEQLVRSPYLARLATLILDDNRIGPGGCEALARSENLLGLRRLEMVRNRFGDGGVRALVHSPCLRRLQWLGLFANDLGPQGVEALTGSELLENLTELDLSYNDLGDAGATVLARSGRLSNLEVLEMTACGLTARGVAALVRAAMPRLTRLQIAQNGLGDQGLAALASAPFLPRLTELRLGFPAGPDGIRALAAADLSSLRVLEWSLQFNRPVAEAFAVLPTCPGLRSLVMRGPTGLTGKVLETFAHSPLLTSLAHLEFSGDLNENEAAVLLSSPTLSRLRTLELYGNKIGVAGARALGTSGHLTNLRKLLVSFSRLGDEGLAMLVGSPNPPPLTWLDLQCNDVGEDGIRALVSRSDRLPLTHLNLSSNRLTDDAAILLARSPLMARLTKLDLRRNPITDRGAEALLEPARRNPGLRLLLTPGYPVPVAGIVGPGPEMQARLKEALGRRVDCSYWDTHSW